MGLYFRKDPPKYKLPQPRVREQQAAIPPNTKVHEETAEQTVKADAIIYTLHPHAHYRGKASSFVAYYPDGKTETLLNVPAYDFNWQGTYELAKPMPVPAGTRIVYTQWYDNSTQNKANPDPNREVTWGEQTWDEMIFGVIRYRNVKEDGATRRRKVRRRKSCSPRGRRGQSKPRLARPPAPCRYRYGSCRRRGTRNGSRRAA